MIKFNFLKSFALLLFAVNLHAQDAEFACNLKMTEYAQWKVTETAIVVVNNLITVNEIYGIELRMSVDKRTESESGVVMYSLMMNGNDNIRLTYQMRSPGQYLVSALNSHYICILKTNN